MSYITTNEANKEIEDWLAQEQSEEVIEPELPIGSEELANLLFPYYEYVINAFGPDRCMFESNFPVDKECISYRTLWNALMRIARTLGLSESEKTAIFSGTAARIYRLSLR